MIRYSELQLGDYVLVEGKIRRVESLTKRKIGFHINEEKKRLYYARLCEVFPIEITEELLIKIGFGEVDLDGLIIQYEQGRRLCLKLQDSLFGNYFWYYSMSQSGEFWFMDFWGHITGGFHKVNRTVIRSLHDLRCLVKATSGHTLDIKL